MKLSIWKRLAGTFASACLLSLGALPVAAQELRIDRLDVQGFAVEKSPNYGKVVFFLDMFDDKNQYLTGFEKGENQIKVFVDDQEVEGTFEVKTFKEANQALAVGVLVAAHNSYAQYDPDIPGTVDVLELLKQGFSTFLSNLSNQNYVAAWYYNDDGLNRVYSWSNRPDEAASAINERVKAGEKRTGQSPALYAHVQKVMESFKEFDATLPSRRVLVLVSDGKDTNTEKPAQLERRLNAIAEEASTSRVKVYAIGFTQDIIDPLSHLTTLAAKTNGIYRRLATDRQSEIATEIESIARELQNQYVVTFTPSKWRGSETPVEFRLEVTASNGTPMKKTYAEKVKPGMTSVDHWNAWLKYVVYGVSGVAAILLGIWIARMMAAARAKRPIVVYEGDEQVGPYKGKLMAIAGAHVGQEFYLTEDLTIIGSMPGNTVMLQEEGVSRRHAGIKIEDMRFELADLGSTNGTWVNGAKINKQFLRDGDVIRIGECQLKFSLK